MKRIISLILAVMMISAVLTGCKSTSEDYDYKAGYERLYQTVMDLENKFPGNTVCVCFGDSLLGMPEVPKDYASVIAAETGLETVNAGFGGASIAKNPNEAYDAFSLYSLVDAIVSGDWTLQDEKVSELPLANSASRLKELKEVDWSKVSIVTLGMGLNDINDGYMIDNVEDPKNVSTVKGAMRYSIEKLIAAYPQIRIMILTPTYRFMIKEGKGCNEITYNGNTYIQYIDALTGIAKEYNLPYVDLYRTLGISAINYKQYFIEGDGTHFNSKGNELIGNRIANELLFYFK